ncbi:MAG: MarR family transcriptional regulator [Syntrophomonas sp.]
MSNLENVTEDLLALLGYIRDTFFRPAEQITRSRISHAQFHAISILAHKGSLSMSELANEMKISKQQLTPLIGKLIDSNMVVRKPEEMDRRILRIEITEPGRDTLEEVKAEVKQAIKEKLSILSNSDLKDLDHLLTQTRELLQSIK